MTTSHLSGPLAIVGSNSGLTGTIATAVSGAATLNGGIGVVTSEAITTAAGATYTLTLTNNEIYAAGHNGAAAPTVVLASVCSGTNTTAGLDLQEITPANGSVVIKVKNTHATAALNGTIVISFLAVKTNTGS